MDEVKTVKKKVLPGSRVRVMLGASLGNVQVVGLVITDQIPGMLAVKPPETPALPMLFGSSNADLLIPLASIAYVEVLEWAYREFPAPLPLSPVSSGDDPAPEPPVSAA